MVAPIHILRRIVKDLVIDVVVSVRIIISLSLLVDLPVLRVNNVKTRDFKIHALLQNQINILIMETIIAKEMSLVPIQHSKLQKKHV